MMGFFLAYIGSNTTFRGVASGVCFFFNLLLFFFFSNLSLSSSPLRLVSPYLTPIKWREPGIAAGPETCAARAQRGRDS